MTTESTSPAGTDSTGTAPTTEAPAPPEATSLLTDGQGTQQPGSDETAPAEKTEAEGKPDEGAKPAEGAPEKYEAFKAPEGVDLDPEVVTKAQDLAREFGLTQEKAQQVADLLAQQTQAVAAKQVSQVAEIHQGWIEEVKADKEVGGEKLAENLAAAKAAMEATTSPQMRMLLQRTGLGNNVEVIRHFLKIAPAFAEAKHVPGGNKPPGQAKSAAEVLYPKT